MKSCINQDVFSIIKKRFNILSIIDSFYYIDNFEKLENQIKEFNNTNFKKNDRILIFYQDTGYYIDLIYGTSVFFNNLYTLLIKYNIPSEFLIIFTNHYGIKKEINILNKKMNYSINKIIETSLWFDFPSLKQIDKIRSESLCFENNFLYTCLNGMQRAHRNYTLCQLKEKNLLDLGIVSYRFKK